MKTTLAYRSNANGYQSYPNPDRETYVNRSSCPWRICTHAFAPFVGRVARGKLCITRGSSQSNIKRRFQPFGVQAMQEVRRALRVRGGAEDRALVVFQRQALCFVRGSGAIMPATTVAALAIARAAAEVPRHDFHCEDDSKKECGGPRINDPKASPSEGRGCGLAKT